MLSHIARASLRRRRLVVAIWVLVFFVAIVGGSALKGDTATTGRLPHTDSQAAYDMLGRDFPQRHGDEGKIVVADVRRHQQAIDRYLAGVARIKGVIGVQPLHVSDSGSVAVASITITNRSGDHPKRTANDIRDLAGPLES